MAVKKIIACADIHFRNLEGLEDLQETLNIFLDQCRQIVANEKSPDDVRIVVAGDIFESKINISNESNIAVGWFFRELNSICKTIVIAGNHDLILYNLQRVDSVSPLFQIGNFENVVYLDAALDYQSGVYEDDNIVWCLYSIFSGYSRPDEIEQYKAHNPDKKFIGVFHGDVNGSVDFAGRTTENGIDAGVFEGLDFVIAGHIHKRQEIKKNGVKVVYCSSIKQKDFGETVNQHGYVLIKVGAKLSYEFVDIVNPNVGFYKFKIDDIKDIEEDKEELINY